MAGMTICVPRVLLGICGMSHDAGQTVAVALPSVPQAIPNDGQIEIPYPPSQLTVLDQGRAVGGQSFLAGMS
ncbi:hypothetical protein DEFR109230_06560 [Deinococcus frigens]|nr:hypothetical protein [Deinococcus frigens]